MTAERRNEPETEPTPKAKAPPVDPEYGKPDIGARLAEIIAEIRNALARPEQGLPGERLGQIADALSELLDRIQKRPKVDNTLPEAPEPKAEKK